MDTEITVIEARDLIRSKKTLQLIDLRSPVEYNRGSIQGFINIPLSELSLKIPQLEGRKHTLLLCQDGTQSHQGLLLLEATGFNVQVVRGGLRDWARVIDPTLPV
ncbi:MAG: rhodanese [SAR324 cluster bacterium]|uniref:Rhodanese n=1 Tax=SAR324 cluster bacterium TaxID=2024889 RepID=A0A2A4T9X1_9DELT|nr:MAG: rhodanese [SAR324 cluster bacterium]